MGQDFSNGTLLCHLWCLLCADSLQIVGCPISLGEGTFVWSQVGAEPSRAQCDRDHWEDSNSASLIIPSAIISSSCCPAQPWCRQCLGERRNICPTKGSEKPSSFIGCGELGREGEKEELEIIVCRAHTKKLFLFLSCLISRQNFTPCRCSSSVLPLFCRLLPLGSL